MTDEEKLKKMNDLVEAIRAATAAAVKFADEHGLSFSEPLSGLDYYGTTWESSDEWEASYSGRWMSSSDYC